MARPSLFVRSLEQGEMEFLGHLRKSRRYALRQRAEILLASMVYTPVYQIALIFRTDEAYVRKVIHAFNDFGFESLNPKVGTGRPKTFEPAIRERMIAIALAPPTTGGEPFDALVVATPEELPGASQDGAAHLDRDAALHPARKERHFPAHTLVEAQHRPRLRGEGHP